MSVSTVSVIIPTHNRAKLLRRAIESVRAQTYADWEIIVVDDGSKDETPSVARSYCNQDRRVRYVGQDNSGEPTARNAGLENATGRYVAFLDDDDEWLPEKLAVQVAFMEAHPEIGLSYTYAAGGRLPDGAPNAAALYGRPIKDQFEDLLNWPNSISSSAVMMRRERLKELAGFDVRYEICADYDFWLRFGQRGRMASLEQVLTVHGARDGRLQLTDDPIRNQLAAIRVLSNLQLTPDHRRYARRKQRHIARIHYSVARDLIDLKRYAEAAKHFLAALAIDPMVGMMVRRPGERGLALVARAVKPYLSAPWCIFQGIRASTSSARTEGVR